MEQGFFVLIVIGVVAAIAVGMYFSAQRRKELTAWAQSKGLRFRSGKDRGMEDRSTNSNVSVAATADMQPTSCPVRGMAST